MQKVIEVDMHFEKKPRNIQYLEISLNSHKQRSLSSKRDLTVSLYHTQIIEFNPRLHFKFNLEEIEEAIGYKHRNEISPSSLILLLTEDLAYERF